MRAFDTQEPANPARKEFDARNIGERDLLSRC